MKFSRNTKKNFETERNFLFVCNVIVPQREAAFKPTIGHGWRFCARKKRSVSIASLHKKRKKLEKAHSGRGRKNWAGKAKRNFPNKKKIELEMKHEAFSSHFSVSGSIMRIDI